MTSIKKSNLFTQAVITEKGKSIFLRSQKKEGCDERSHQSALHAFFMKKNPQPGTSSE